MLIGSGLLARAFTQFREDKQTIIFASGVSNSSSANAQDFERELQLIKAQENFRGTFVYFSTCSIYDPSQQNSPYINHKRSAEELIQSLFQSYFIVRLPNVIGPTSNPHTFTNFFFDKITKGETITVHRHATRYFIHIDDVFQCVNHVLKNVPSLAHCSNLVIYEKIDVPQAVKVFESILGQNANIALIDKGESYSVTADKLFNLDQFDRDMDPSDALRQMLLRNYR